MGRGLSAHSTNPTPAVGPSDLGPVPQFLRGSTPLCVWSGAKKFIHSFAHLFDLILHSEIALRYDILHYITLHYITLDF